MDIIFFSHIVEKVWNVIYLLNQIADTLSQKHT